MYDPIDDLRRGASSPARHALDRVRKHFAKACTVLGVVPPSRQDGAEPQPRSGAAGSGYEEEGAPAGPGNGAHLALSVGRAATWEEGRSQRSGRSSHRGTLPAVALSMPTASLADTRPARRAAQTAFCEKPASAASFVSEPAIFAAFSIKDLIDSPMPLCSTHIRVPINTDVRDSGCWTAQHVVV